MMTKKQRIIADCIMDYYFKNRSNPSVLDGAFSRNERINEISNANYKEFRQDVHYVREVLLDDSLIENNIGSNTNEDYCKITANGISIIQENNTYSFYKWKEKESNNKIDLQKRTEYKIKLWQFYLAILGLVISITINIFQAIM